MVRISWPVEGKLVKLIFANLTKCVPFHGLTLYNHRHPRLGRLWWGVGVGFGAGSEEGGRTSALKPLLCLRHWLMHLLLPVHWCFYVNHSPWEGLLCRALHVPCDVHSHFESIGHTCGLCLCPDASCLEVLLCLTSLTSSGFRWETDRRWSGAAVGWARRLPRECPLWR